MDDNTRRELQDLNPDLRNRIRDLIEDSPYRVGITSSWRSYAEQKRLYDGWVARKPGFNPANPPGRSKHEKVDSNGNPASEACDLKYYSTNGQEWVHRNATKYGLKFPISKENWHAESNGRPYRSKEETMAKLDAEDLANIQKIVDNAVLKITGGVRSADKRDRDVKNISNADLLTAIERLHAPK